MTRLRLNRRHTTSSRHTWWLMIWAPQPFKCIKKKRRNRCYQQALETHQPTLGVALFQGFTAETRTLPEETGGTKIEHLPLHQPHVLLRPGQTLCVFQTFMSPLNTIVRSCCTKMSQDKLTSCPTSYLRQFLQWPQQDDPGLLWPSHALYGTSWRLVQASGDQSMCTAGRGFDALEKIGKLCHVAGGLRSLLP